MWLICRGEHLKAIRANGLKLIRPDSEFVVEVNATDNPAEVGPVDLVLFTVKTYQNRHVITALKPLMGPETSVITLQNGVESHEQLGAVLGPSHILPGAYWASSHVISPVSYTLFPAHETLRSLVSPLPLEQKTAVTH